MTDFQFAGSSRSPGTAELNTYRAVVNLWREFLGANLCTSRIHPKDYDNRGDGMTWPLFVHAVEQRLR
jgi:hypothetical protein